MATKNESKELAKRRFSSFQEPAISFSLVEKVNLNLVKALVEAYNLKFKTNFWVDEKRFEIVHAGIVREGRYDHFSNLRELMERKGYADIALCESAAAHISNVQRLLESELEQAEVVLAAQSLSDRLQKMVEDIAGMMAEDVLPIADQMKMAFGTEYAEKWQSVVRSSLENGFETLGEIRNSVSNANLVLERALEGDVAPVSDMADFDSDEEDISDDLGLEGGEEAETDDDDIDDLLGGDDAASGPEDEPLGRAKRESVEPKGKKLVEKKSLATMGGVKPDGSHSNRLKSDPRHPKNKGVSARPGFVGEKVNEVAPLAAKAGAALAGMAARSLAGSVARSQTSQPVGERNAFIDALNKAVDKGEDSFDVDGKKFKVTDKAAKTFEEMVYEHDDYMDYVQPWRERGFSVYVSRPHRGALMFEIERDGVERTVYEPEEGVYEIVGHPGIKFDSLDAAIRHAYVLDEVEEALEALEEDAEMQIGVKKGEKVVLSNPRAKPRHVVKDIKGDNAIVARNGNEDDLVTVPLDRIKRMKKKALDFKDGVKEDAGALATQAAGALKAGGKAVQPRKDPKRERAERDLEQALARNPRLASTVSDLMSEAIETVKEDISFGITEAKAIKNAAMLHDLKESELKKAWLAK